MSNSRQKILDFIVEQQSTTVEEISKVFRVTQSNIRHHLAILTEQGNVKVIGQKSNRGRPAQIYASTSQIDQHNLDKLSNVLLSILFNQETDDHTQLLGQIAIQLTTDFNSSGINPTRRLYSTIQSLNRMNYQAHWEAHYNHPRIILGHCPYQAILNDHPVLCQLDVSLLEHQLDTKVRQIEKQIINNYGFTECIFLID